MCVVIQSDHRKAVRFIVLRVEDALAVVRTVHRIRWVALDGTVEVGECAHGNDCQDEQEEVDENQNSVEEPRGDPSGAPSLIFFHHESDLAPKAMQASYFDDFGRARLEALLSFLARGVILCTPVYYVYMYTGCYSTLQSVTEFTYLATTASIFNFS